VINITLYKNQWDRERQTLIKAAKERSESALLDSDVEIDPPLKHYHSKSGAYQNNHFRDRDENGDNFGTDFVNCNDPDQKSLKQLAFENLGIQGNDYVYPVNKDGKVFEITKMPRRRIFVNHTEEVTKSEF
jgi:hypothetical protein